MGRFRPGWQSDPELDSRVLMDIGIHSFYLTEPMHPEPAQSVLAGLPFMDRGADDHAFCRRRMGTGGTGLVNAGYFGAPVRAVRVGSASGQTVTHYVPQGRTQFTPVLFDDLVHTLTGAGSAFRSFDPDGRQTLEIANAAYPSVETGLPAELPLTADQAIYSDGPVTFVLSRKEHASVG